MGRIKLTNEERISDNAKERQRARYKANKEQILEKAREYRAANKERLKEIYKKSREANKEKYNAYQKEYKARKRQERALELEIQLAEIKKAEPKRSALPKYSDFIKTENDIRHYEMLKIQCQNLRLTGSL
jgi:hypothetical protein